MSEYRICRIGCVRPGYVTAAGYGHTVARFGASFGYQQIIPAVFFVNVRCFGISTACSVPYVPAFTQLLSAERVDLTQPYAVVRIADHVASAVLEI